MLTIPLLDNFYKCVKRRGHNSWVDELSHYITSLILFFFALIVGAKQYVGDPIQCFVPAEYIKGWEEYVEDYCYIQNTYFSPMEEWIPTELSERAEREIGYYQWVPFVLALQALMFYIPCLLWTGLSWLTASVSSFYVGISVETIMSQASDYGKTAILGSSKDRKEAISILARYVEESLDLLTSPGGMRERDRGCFRRFRGSRLCILYIFVKIVYVANVVGQFFLLNKFLGMDNGLWGIRVLKDSLRGTIH